MLRHRFYYALKPFVPWRLRIVVRRILARRIRESCLATWPINERAATRPPEWTGWPDGKKFAFVITHDVEGSEGLAKCRQLAELEIKHGFRSSFNFIPEGPYRVPSELRLWLTDHGFEVGVHDLKHDGKLFTSKSGFAAKAQRINHYLRTWQAIGYRSGFMLRNLDWLHHLSICYDSSTFDTDPFEPQPDGVNTIFPYWIPTGCNGAAALDGVNGQSGYVELPYTLPQDSTLYLVLEEKTTEIWLRKLDWIAAHGGMALINIHPDYVYFEGEKSTTSTYSVKHYMELLHHVSSRYPEDSWLALPKEAALHYRRSISGLNPITTSAT